jgi:hypothetical protein
MPRSIISFSFKDGLEDFDSNRDLKEDHRDEDLDNSSKSEDKGLEVDSNKGSKEDNGLKGDNCLEVSRISIGPTILKRLGGAISFVYKGFYIDVD